MDAEIRADEKIEPPMRLRPDVEPTGPVGLSPSPRRIALSPINQRRWRNFKTNRRGYFSLWVFLVLFVVSLFAEVIANDKPLYISYQGKSYFPILFAYPETTFGGDFETAADYRDPFVQKLIADKNGSMIWPPIRYSYATHNLDLPTPAPSKPTWLLDRERMRVGAGAQTP